MSRSFTIIDYPKEGEVYGRYLSNSPGRAANKAFTQLSRMMNIKNSNNKNYLVFSIKETTNGSNKQKYKYIGTRIKLHKPIVINKGGKLIKINYRNVVAKYKDHFNT